MKRFLVWLMLAFCAVSSAAKDPPSNVIGATLYYDCGRLIAVLFVMSNEHQVGVKTISEPPEELRAAVKLTEKMKAQGTAVYKIELHAGCDRA